MYKWLQYEQKTHKKISTQALLWLDENGIGPYKLAPYLEQTGLSAERAVNYIKKQRTAVKDTLQVWQDYLAMAQRLEYDLHDDIVRIPKDLKAQHDRMVEISGEHETEERIKKNRAKYAALDKAIMERLPEARIYYWQNMDYMIIPAGKCAELMEEGRKLHHCVGSSDVYMKKMAEGKSWILFLRKKADTEMPYYTIEIDMKDDHIKQWYSAFDRKPDKDEVEKVLKKFRREIRKRRKKEAAVGAEAAELPEAATRVPVLMPAM